MSFRQFPALGPNGEPWVIIEFREESATGNAEHANDGDSPRYELADGRRLLREGRVFRTSGGEMTLTI